MRGLLLRVGKIQNTASLYLKSIFDFFKIIKGDFLGLTTNAKMVLNAKITSAQVTLYVWIERYRKIYMKYILKTINTTRG